MQREIQSWLPLGTSGVRELVGSLDLANREQIMVIVSSKVVTVQVTAVKTLG
jgi:hypothetical protein